jgi:hypothetical protein
MRLLSGLVLLMLLLAVSGCQKVALKNEYDLDPTDAKGFDVDPPNRDQDVTLKITTTGPIDVFIANKADWDKAIADVKAPKSPLGGKAGIDKEATVTAKVPAKTAYGIVLLNAKKPKTKVTVEMNAQ